MITRFSIEKQYDSGKESEVKYDTEEMGYDTPLNEDGEISVQDAFKIIAKEIKRNFKLKGICFHYDNGGQKGFARLTHCWGKENDGRRLVVYLEGSEKDVQKLKDLL